VRDDAPGRVRTSRAGSPDITSSAATHGGARADERAHQSAGRRGPKADHCPCADCRSGRNQRPAQAVDTARVRSARQQAPG